MILTEEQKASIDANRRQYEALKSAGQKAAPGALSQLTRKNEAAISPAAILARETIPGGWYYALSLSRGEALRLVNADGTSSASVIAWNADEPSERINHADSVKVQWTANLRKGRVILSDMGKVVFSIVEDTSGAHDALVGGSTAASNARRYGGDFRNTRDNFILAAGKLGLARRDIPQPVTFFAPLDVDAKGAFVWDEARRAKNDFVDLRAEMNLLVVISNCPHPLDPREIYAPGQLEVLRYLAAASPEDPCRHAGPEAARAFENTEAAQA